MSENSIYDPDYVRTLFNKMAKTYDRVNRVSSFGFSVRWRRQFIRKLNHDAQSPRVLDLMSGMGETWEILHSHFPEATIDALDYSDAMVESARKKAEALPDLGLTVIHDNVLEAGTLNDSSYDVIICAFGLKTFNEEQLETFAKVVNRVLKPGGSFSFIEISVPPNRLLRTLYGFYTGRIVPIVGKLLLGDPETYRMLWTYTSRFGNCGQTIGIFRKHGFDVNEESYFFGCSTGFTGRKKAEMGSDSKRAGGLSEPRAIATG